MKNTIQIMLAIELLMLVLGILKLIVMGVKSDLAGQGMTVAYTVIATILALILIGSAYALVSAGKWLWLALILAVIAAVLSLVVLLME